jgi:uncharacterized membrane protein
MEPEQLGQELSDQDRVLLVFGYLGPLALFVLVASRREFVKWHAKQGLVLSVTLLLVYPFLRYFYIKIRSLEGSWLTPFAEVLWWMGWAVVLGVLIVALVCIVRALEGERFKIPVLGDIADRL